MPLEKFLTITVTERTIKQLEDAIGVKIFREDGSVDEDMFSFALEQVMNAVS